MNELACDPKTAALFYSWNFSLNIKTAGKIKRLASTNHEIDYSLGRRHFGSGQAQKG